MSNLLEYFDLYNNKLNWQIIPLRPGTKLPFTKGWNSSYDRDAMRSYFINDDDYNIGLKLGEIIDVEADDEHSNAQLTRLTNSTPHPHYKSTKSIHHLFQTPDPSLTRIVIHGMEFRGHKHQSVLPPSIVDGVKYQWIDTCGFVVPPLPESLLNLYHKHDKMMRTMYTDKWVMPWCAACFKQRRPIHRKRYELEIIAFKQLGQKWQCHKCRKIDVRPICRKIKSLGITNNSSSRR